MNLVISEIVRLFRVEGNGCETPIGGDRSTDAEETDKCDYKGVKTLFFKAWKSKPFYGPDLPESALESR
jgi:hypothetical protein